MRKRLIRTENSSSPSPSIRWLDLERLAQIEISSEDEIHPIDSALTPGTEGGWRAVDAGEQTIRVIFDRTQSICRIHLLFDEQERSRTQEFVLRWSSDIAGPFREICRQQWNFSPPHNTLETEDYSVDLTNVSVLELVIKPDISGGEARATLRELYVA
jgi:hypothetical protein